MSLLRIITGYRRDDYREEVPEILYLGYDADAARAASDAAPAEFLRIELVESRRGQRLRKAIAAPEPPTVEAPEDDLPPPPATREEAEAALRAMKPKQLQSVADECRIETKGLDKEAIIAAILGSAPPTPSP